MYAEHGAYGNAEVFVRLKEAGYTRNFGSICKQIRKQELRLKTNKKQSYTKYNNITG